MDNISTSNGLNQGSEAVMDWPLLWLSMDVGVGGGIASTGHFVFLSPAQVLGDEREYTPVPVFLLANNCGIL